MSDARRQAKKDKKAKARREKAKGLRARQAEARKADRESEKRTPTFGGRGFTSDSKQASSKPSGRSNSPGHRTQGK